MTPGFAGGTYAYFLTEAWPVIPRCFVGTPDPSFERRGPHGRRGGGRAVAAVVGGGGTSPRCFRPVPKTFLNIFLCAALSLSNTTREFSRIRRLGKPGSSFIVTWTGCLSWKSSRRRCETPGFSDFFRPAPFRAPPQPKGKGSSS